MSSYSVIFFFFISFACINVVWTFSYSYSINHGGNARSFVSVSRGWPSSRSNHRVNPHFQTAHYSPPNGIQYRPQVQPVPLLPPQSPQSPHASINPQINPPPSQSLPQAPQFQPQPQSPPLRAPKLPSTNTYSQNRYDRICTRTDSLKGFPVGVTSKTNEQCYYLCSTGRRFLSRPFYFCCPSGFKMDYDKRLCVEILSTPQTVAPPIKRVLTPEEEVNSSVDWSQRRRTGTGVGPENFKSGTEKPMGKCVPGVPVRAHPSKCDHYLQCVFNAYYIGMKCPGNLAWNDRRKYCDTRKYSACEDKGDENDDFESQRNRKQKTKPPPPPPSEREYDESRYTGVKAIRPFNPTRERVLQVPRPLGPPTTSTTVRPEVLQIRCTNRFQEAFYRRRFGIDCRKAGFSHNDGVKSKTNEGEFEQSRWPEKTAYGQRRKKPFWWSFGGNKGIKGVKGSDQDEKGTKSGTKSGDKRPPVKSRPTTVITTTTTTTTTEAPLEMTTEATPEPTTRFSKPTTDAQETQVTEDDQDSISTNRQTTIRNLPTTPSVVTTVQLPETTASEVFTRRPPTTIFTTIPTTAKQLPPEMTTEFSTTNQETTASPSITVLTTTVTPPTTELKSTTITSTLPTTQTDEDYEEADDDNNNNDQPTSKAASTTTSSPFPSLDTIPPPLPTYAPLVNITSTTHAPETTTFTQIFEENARCQEPGQRLKDADDCQCYFECQLNRQLTRNCCPEGLLFNQNESKPGSSANGGDTEADAESEDSEGEQGACDIASNVQCLTTIQ